MDYNIILEREPSMNNIALFIENQKPDFLLYLSKHVEQSADAEDIYQAALIKFIKKEPEIDLGYRSTIKRSIKHYVGRFIREELVNYKRKTNSYNNRFIFSLDIEHDSKKPSPYQVLEKRELLDSIEKEVNDLPEKFRTVMKQKYYLGLINSEIAENEMISYRNVDKRRRKALEILRIRLKDAI